MEIVKDSFKYQKVVESFMSEQINLRFSKELFEMAKTYAKEQGYLNVQELMREALREKIVDSLELRSEYKKTLQSKEARTFLNKEESQEFEKLLQERSKLE